MGQTLKNCRIWHGGYDVSGRSNEIGLAYKAELKDSTVFNVGARRRIAGLTDAEVTGGGFWDAGLTDPALLGGVAVDGLPLSISPSAGAAGEIVYMIPSALAEYVRSGTIGEIVAFDFAASGSGVMVRGRILDYGAVAASGAGSGIQAGAAADGQLVHAVLHVLGVTGAGTEITVAIDSSAEDAWTGDETQRVLFAAATGPGAQWISVAGPITDTWWRARWTITGTEPGAVIAVELGIR